MTPLQGSTHGRPSSQGFALGCVMAPLWGFRPCPNAHADRVWSLGTSGRGGWSAACVEASSAFVRFGVFRGRGGWRAAARREPRAASAEAEAASCKLQAASCEPRAASAEPEASSHKPQAPSCKPQAPSCKLQAASHELRAPRRGHQASSPHPRASADGEAEEGRWGERLGGRWRGGIADWETPFPASPVTHHVSRITRSPSPPIHYSVSRMPRHRSGPGNVILEA